jgi:hypothetical protein
MKLSVQVPRSNNKLGAVTLNSYPNVAFCSIVVPCWKQLLLTGTKDGWRVKAECGGVQRSSSMVRSVNSWLVARRTGFKARP